MSEEQEGPPTSEQRERRDTDWLKAAQEHYAEGYRARAYTAPPDAVSRTTRSGREVKRAQPYLSLADQAETLCPKDLPAHFRERWLAGFSDADRYATQYGHSALADRDPLKPPRKPRMPPLAEPLDAFADDVPRLTREQARAWWDHHRGKTTEYAYRDAGEQP